MEPLATAPSQDASILMSLMALMLMQSCVYHSRSRKKKLYSGRCDCRHVAGQATASMVTASSATSTSESTWPLVPVRILSWDGASYHLHQSQPDAMATRHVGWLQETPGFNPTDEEHLTDMLPSRAATPATMLWTTSASTISGCRHADATLWH